MKPERSRFGGGIRQAMGTEMTWHVVSSKMDQGRPVVTFRLLKEKLNLKKLPYSWEVTR